MLKFVDKFNLKYLVLFYGVLYASLYYYKNSYKVYDYSIDIYYSLSVVIIAINFILLNYILNNNAKIIACLWFFWPVLGILYSGSFNNVKKIWQFGAEVSINFPEPIFIHYLFSSFFCLGILLYERWFLPKTRNDFIDQINVPITEGFPSLVLIPVLLIFPTYYAFSIYVNWGSIPLLSGENIVDRMYEVNSGFSQAFVIFIFFSAQYSFYKTISSNGNASKFFWFFVTVMFLFFSVVDGKRVVLLLSIIGNFVLYVKIRGVFSRSVLYVASALASLLYVIIDLIRSSRYFYFNLDRLFGVVGVEFMEFSWTVTYFDPGKIPGYNWTLSTLFSMLNSSVLAIFGIEKHAYVVMDSARSWAKLHNTSFGIRSGIVSEIYFEYGILGLVFMVIFGMIFVAVCYAMAQSKSYNRFTLLLCVYSLFALAIMSQSTVTFGSLTTVFYILLFMKFTETLDGIVRSKRCVGLERKITYYGG